MTSSEKFLKSIPHQMWIICIVQSLAMLCLIGFYFCFVYPAFQKQEAADYRFEQDIPALRHRIAIEQDTDKLRHWADLSLTSQEANNQMNRSNHHFAFVLMKYLGFELLFSAFAFGLFAYKLNRDQAA